MLGPCSINDVNVQLFRAERLTLKVQCRGLPQLFLMAPSGEPSYWLLQLPHMSEDKMIRLGTIEELPPGNAKKLARALLQPPMRTAEDGPTLKRFLKIYQRAHASRLASGTQAATRSYSRRLNEAFGDEPMTWICARAVKAWHAHYSKRSPGAADQAKDLLRAVINRAKDWGVISEHHANPCDGIPRNRSAPGNRSFSADELAALGAILDQEERDPRYRTQARRLRFTLFTGCRPGEVRNLAWSSVIHTDGQPSHLQLPTSKTGPRRIELNTDSQAVLISQAARGASSVFPADSNPDRPYSEWQAARYWRRLVKKANLTTESRQYWLRHTFGTNVLLAGGTTVTAGSLLGHSRPATTIRYLHIPPNHVIEAGQRIGERIADWIGLTEQTKICEHAAHNVAEAQLDSSNINASDRRTSNAP